MRFHPDPASFFAPIYLTLATGLTIGICACSGSHASSLQPAIHSRKPLSADETQQLKTVFASIGQLNGLGNLLSKSHAPNGRPQSREVAQAKARWTQILALMPSNPSAQEAPSTLGQLVDNGDCAVKVTLPEDGSTEVKAGDTHIPKLRVDVTGAACPIVYSVTVDGQQKGLGFEARLELSYEAVSAEAKQLNDIDKMTESGVLSMGVQVTQTPNAMTQDLDVKIAINSQGHSQSQGDFISQNENSGKMRVSVSGMGGMSPQSGFGQGLITTHFLAASGHSPGGLTALPSGGIPGIQISGLMNERYAYQFAGITAELTSSADFNQNPPKIVYQLNGQSISEDDYKQLRDAIQLPGTPSDQNNPGGQTTPGGGSGFPPSGGGSFPPSGDGSFPPPSGSGSFPPPSGGGSFPPPSGGGSFPAPGPTRPAPNPAALMICQVQVFAHPRPSDGAWPMQQIQSCGHREEKSIQLVSGETITIGFEPQPGYVQLSSSVCGLDHHCDSVDRAFLAGETKSFDDKVGNYILHSTCQPVSACPRN